MLDARILQARGYTQVQIAEMLKVTDRTVRNYLRYPPRGRKRPVRARPFSSSVSMRLEAISLAHDLAAPRLPQKSIRSCRPVMANLPTAGTGLTDG